MKNIIYENERIMKDDLRQLYDKICRENPGISQIEVIRRLSVHPAPQFYLTPLTASRVLPRLKERDFDKRLENLSAERYFDLLKVVNKLMKDPRNEGKEFLEIVTEAVSMPAPRFYISYESLYKLFAEREARPYLANKERMRNDLRQLYDNIYRENPGISQQEVIQRLCVHPAPQFYITATTAYPLLAKLKKGDFNDFDCLGDNSRKRYLDLLRVVNKLLKEPRNKGRELFDVVTEAVSMPAPQFYISPESLHKLLWDREAKNLEEFKKTDIFTSTSRMKNDLMKVFREVCKSYSCHFQTEAYNQVVRHPAPCYYLNPRRALQVISPMSRGDYSKLTCLSPLRQEMYLALFDTVQRMYQSPRYHKKSLYFVLQFAVNEPAPRFYINADRMRQIWKECTRRTRKEAGNEADNN